MEDRQTFNLRVGSSILPAPTPKSASDWTWLSPMAFGGQGPVASSLRYSALGAAEKFACVAVDAGHSALARYAV